MARLRCVFWFALIVVAVPAAAHEPYLLLVANPNGTFTAEAGFSDAASPEGLKLTLRDRTSGEVISEHALPKSGILTMKTPAVPYRVAFDGGPGHRVSKPGPDAETTPSSLTVIQPPAVEPTSTPVSMVEAVGTGRTSPFTTPTSTVGPNAAPVRVSSATPVERDQSFGEFLRVALLVGIFFLFGSIAFAFGYGAGLQAR